MKTLRMLFISLALCLTQVTQTMDNAHKLEDGPTVKFSNAESVRQRLLNVVKPEFLDQTDIVKMLLPKVKNPQTGKFERGYISPVCAARVIIEETTVYMNKKIGTMPAQDLFDFQQTSIRNMITELFSSRPEEQAKALIYFDKVNIIVKYNTKR